jgi:hexosaminidase
MKTKWMLWLLTGVMMLQLSCTQTTNEYNLVPYPQELMAQAGKFEIKPTTRVLYSGTMNAQFVAKSLADFVNPSTGFALKPEMEKSSELIKDAILFVEDPQMEGVEGSYQLNVQPNGVLIKSNSPVGLYYGFQTLRQLLPVEIERTETVNGIAWTIPAASITDAPRFSYRGLHLDVGRHFFPVDFIKKYIDLLALHKMNVFHWHLTEDQGWRLEIKKYPKLAEVAAFRDETLVGHLGNKERQYDGQRYGGYYTQEQAREIVKYAADRFITVIPEIELPGHAQAALTAYPELGCTGGPYEVATEWGVFKEVFCAGNDKAFEFLEDVLLEVMDIFPSEYIHIGGDECPKERWNECPKCEKRMKQEGCHDAHELQSYFIGRIEKFLNSHKRNIIGWDEILEGGLAPNATVMSWRGIKGGVEAAKQKHNVIMTPNTHFYLDYYQNEPSQEPLAIGGYLPLSKVYSYNPMAGDLTPEEAKYIIGVQGNVWTEYMKESSYVEYMTYPRACAIAEVGWLDFEKRDFEVFASRLKHHLKRMDELGVNYFNKVLMPTPSVEKVEFVDKASLTLKNNAIGAQLYYTLDGSVPNNQSNEYSTPIEISKEGLVKVVAIDEDGKSSDVLEIPSVRIDYIEGAEQKGTQQGLACKLAIGAFSACADVEKAEGKSFRVEQVAIPEQAPHDNFGLVLEGKMTIETEGLYQFQLGSDDGSQLFINGEKVIDNDGFHGLEFKHAALALRAGTYAFKVVFFEGGGGEELRFSAVFPNGERVTDLSKLFSCAE